MKKANLLSITGLLCMFGNAMAFQEFVICRHPDNQWRVSTDGRYVVWDDARNPNGSVYGYDLQTQTSFSVSASGPAYQSWPRVNNGRVAWIDYFHNNDYDIFSYDINTGITECIVAKPGVQHYPYIDNNIMVWADKSSGHDLYAYDFNTGATKFLTSVFGGYHIVPIVSGNLVVWADDREGNFNIYGYDLIRDESFKICDAMVAIDTAVRIDGNILVWSDTRNGSYDIYAFDMSTNQEIVISALPAEQAFPAISGNFIVWHDHRNGDSDIYGYDFLSGQEFLVCGAPGDQKIPDIYGTVVVWVDYRDGIGDIYGTYIPEPATSLLLGLGGLILWRKRRSVLAQI